MNNKHSIEDVLEAVDALLKYKREQKLKIANNEAPLKLTNEVVYDKEISKQIPKDTEEIISQAEKYLKK